jgi:hypothetical protein
VPVWTSTFRRIRVLAIKVSLREEDNKIGNKIIFRAWWLLPTEILVSIERAQER